MPARGAGTAAQTYELLIHSQKLLTELRFGPDPRTANRPNDPRTAHRVEVTAAGFGSFFLTSNDPRTAPHGLGSPRQ